MTRRRALLIVAAAALLGTVAWFGVLSHATPAGQAPLVYLDAESLSGLKDDFNRAAGDVRLIVLLAPT